MDTEKTISESRTIMLVSLIIGVLILSAGIVFNLSEVDIIENERVIVGLSFIPLSVALVYFVKLYLLVKSPRQMRSVVINESDERLVALRNEADAKTFRIFQWVLFMAYLAYTLAVPDDIFESAGWWLILFLLFISYGLQAVLLRPASKKSAVEQDDEK